MLRKLDKEMASLEKQKTDAYGGGGGKESY
jgi:hypothetical protein